MAYTSRKRFVCGLFLTFILLLSGTVFSALGDGGQQKGEGLFFVQITDTHLGERDHLERTRKLVDRIHHRPAVDEYYEYAGAQAWGPHGRAAFEELMRAHKVTASSPATSTAMSCTGAAASLYSPPRRLRASGAGKRASGCTNTGRGGFHIARRGRGLQSPGIGAMRSRGLMVLYGDMGDPEIHEQLPLARDPLGGQQRTQQGAEPGPARPIRFQQP